MPTTDKRTTWSVIGASLLVGAARWLARARVPDDYDSIGFQRGLQHFDLARLQPHFPGYPVYVALGQAAVRLGLVPLAAATLISSLAAAATAAAVWRLGAALTATTSAATTANPRAGGWAALALYAAAWLPWQLGGAALSDATATAFVALAFAALTVEGAPLAALAGAAMALAVGTRASYWPLLVSFAVVVARRPLQRRAALAGGVAGLVAWLAPFVAVVGPTALVRLGRTHLVGHFTSWGGSIATQPDVPLRLWAFARALVHDGLFAHWLALALAAPLVVWCARPLFAPRLRRLALVVAAPYGAWVLLAQNVVEQPRHLLPLVTLGCAALGAVLARRVFVAVAVIVLALAASAPLAWTRAHTPPAAAQAAAWVSSTYPQKNAVAVFGGKSLRFFDELAPQVVTRTRTWLSEVDVELERLDVLPRALYITSEVELDRTRAARVGDGPTFCRDARIDRAQPCLTLRAYRLFR
jgi:hypothetical protein